jgi:uncharacterized protein (DUF2384 family)
MPSEREAEAKIAEGQGQADFVEGAIDIPPSFKVLWELLVRSAAAYNRDRLQSHRQRKTLRDDWDNLMPHSAFPKDRRKSLFTYQRLEDLVAVQKVLETAEYLQTVHEVESKRQPSPEVELIKKGLQVAGSPERLIEWMQTPVPSLNGQTPYSLMGTEEGRKQVETALVRIEHGVY